MATCDSTTVELFLIEDNAGDSLLVSQVVAECQIPIRLRVARDGEQALQMLRDPAYYKPDLIILDMNVPKVPGLEFLRRYKPKEVPVVIFSSSQNVAEIRQAMDLGAREFVMNLVRLVSCFRTGIAGNCYSSGTRCCWCCDQEIFNAVMQHPAPGDIHDVSHRARASVQHGGSEAIDVDGDWQGPLLEFVPEKQAPKPSVVCRDCSE